MHERVFELIIHAKAKARVFPTSFAVILSAVALPIMLKAEFNFELICTLPFLNRAAVGWRFLALPSEF